MSLTSDDQNRRDTDKHAIAEFAVFQGPGVQGCGAIGEELLHFCDEEIAFGEEGAHLEFVVGCAATEDAAGEVDGGEVQDRILFGGDVYFPAFGAYFCDSADDEVADLWFIATCQR